jgi:hypothetical protein
MHAAKQVPYYIEGDTRNNSAAFQVAQLIRNRADAWRLLVPILDATDLPDDEQQFDMAEELAQILQAWDDPDFVKQADRGSEILDELNDLWSDDGPVDMLELGERRVVLDALSIAIAHRCEQLSHKN